MEQEQIAREVRRRQINETLEFEREREQTLEEQIELVVTEVEGKRIDEAAFARMSSEDVAIVDAELNPPPFEADEEPGFFERDDVIDWEDDVDPHAEELARLHAELEDCRRRQRAFQAYLDALDG